ncbi:hypothetical protein [Sphingomonas sp. CCH5-D11]|uniref:hypothetical protein n=1 Tax=Sphingomonas sp. CCH5-D11 TaxID=1768786 RepID=UPI000833C2A2|nr:hypothetical protein [Sphingomonas sp. CCH5-D11]
MKIALPLAALPLAAVALLTPTLAAAQSMNGPNYSTYEPGFRANSLIPASDTPTMRRDKLKRAQTLRAEVDAMMAANGGTLTDKQQAYVRREAKDILNRRAPFR